MIAEIADAIVDDPRQPAQERSFIRVLKLVKSLVRRQVGVLQNVHAFDLLSQPWPQPGANKKQRPLRVQAEEPVVGLTVAVSCFEPKVVGDRVHYS